MSNILNLRPVPEISPWDGRSDIQCAEACTTAVVVGLGVEAADPDGWYWEVVDVRDVILASGFVDTMNEAKSVAVAAATRHLA